MRKGCPFGMHTAFQVHSMYSEWSADWLSAPALPSPSCRAQTAQSCMAALTTIPPVHWASRALNAPGISTETSKMLWILLAAGLSLWSSSVPAGVMVLRDCPPITCDLSGMCAHVSLWTHARVCVCLFSISSLTLINTQNYSTSIYRVFAKGG